MLTQAPRGTRDMLPQDAYLWHMLEAKMRELAALWGYREIRTPIFEHTELFLRGVGGTTDIVTKEMYTFKDKGDRSITLRPEGTAGAVRAFLEGRLYAEPLPSKVYYLAAPIFRYEKPSSGRLREHHQFGMECFGGKEPTVEAELINLLMTLLSSLGLTGLTVHVNSIGCKCCRPRYGEALRAYLGDRLSEMCEDCQVRFEKNPLRILDCKQEKCKAIVAGAPSILDSLCGDCRAHFEKLQGLLTAQGIPFEVDPTIVRGLDYYTRTVFEVIMQAGREGLALCGGGRYDNLVEELGGPDTPAAGFGLGLERILLELRNRNLTPPAPAAADVYVANIGAESLTDAFVFTQKLRAQGVRSESDLCGRSLKAQFKYADKLGVKYIVLVGGEELERGTVKLRDLSTREETEYPLSEAPALIAGLIGKEA